MTSFTESYEGHDWIETYTGRQFRPMQPDASAFSLLDMGHSLSTKCRYNGHTQFFYSVAEHSCHVTKAAWDRGVRDPRVLLELITHDCGETYFPDICRPLKQFCPELDRAEKIVGSMVREWLGLTGEVPAIVHEFDRRIIVDERRAAMSDSPHKWVTDGFEPLGVRIMGWDPQTAESNWLKMTTAVAAQHLGRQVYWQYDVSAFQVSPDNPSLRIQDLVLVDLLGGVGIVIVRDDRGMMVRNPDAGAFPKPLTEFVHGKFTLLT